MTADLRHYLPYRARIRLRVTRRIDVVACWLIDHGAMRTAALLWRVTGLWG